MLFTILSSGGGPGAFLIWFRAFQWTKFRELFGAWISIFTRSEYEYWIEKSLQTCWQNFDKVPRTLWCLDTEFHKWPGHRFPFIALLLINLLRYAVTTCPCFSKDSHLRWSIDTIGCMSQRLQYHTGALTCCGITTSIITGKLLCTTCGLRALLRQPCSIHNFNLLNACWNFLLVLTF